jgi:hypothetical protein
MFESRVNICCVAVGCLLTSVAVRLNMCSKLVRNINFLQNTPVVLISRFTQMVRGTARSHVQHSCFTINLFFRSSYHISKFWHGVFPHPTCTEMRVQTLRIPTLCDSKISRQSAYESGKVVRIKSREHATGWIEPRSILRPEELFQ